MNTLLFAFFAVTTTLLVAVGLYGLLTQLVTDRTREIGVRLALGAQPVQVVAHVVAQSLRVSVLGIASGLAAAAVLAQAMAAVLYGVSPRDPITFAVVSVGLAILVLAVTSLPAGRAATLDPTVTLRHHS
jgi:ABC-type antimicrobial peptide transport system permease subunit